MRRTPTSLASTALAALLVAAATLTGCSAEPSVDQQVVEAEVGERVQDQYGAAPDDVTCPGGLDADPDVVMTCFVTFNGVELDAEVQITDVEDDRLQFRVTLPDELDDPVEEQLGE